MHRDLLPEVVAKKKLHILDTIASMVSGSRFKSGKFAAAYVNSLGGEPQAIVVGTGMVTSTVNAAIANGMSAHADETDDSHLRGRFHPGCGILPAALATAAGVSNFFNAVDLAKVDRENALVLFPRLRQA